MNKVLIWEDYSNKSFASNDSSIQNNLTGKKRERCPTIGLNDPNPSPPKLYCPSPTNSAATTVLYDASWFPDLSLKFCLTAEDFQEVAVQYVVHLLQSKQVNTNGDDILPTTEHTHSLFENSLDTDRPLEGEPEISSSQNEQPNVNAETVLDESIFLFANFDEDEASESSNVILDKRKSFSDSQRRGSSELLFDDNDARNYFLDFVNNFSK